MKLGSLFDGSGTALLAATMCGIKPVWASEIEPYPIAVTHSRFPDVRHLGDVSRINGADIEPVDVIVFGSPCQDMSVAGQRSGMNHIDAGDDETTRSGLFYEAARIIREMRRATNGQYPTFAVWENVLGAFSSNDGNDFRCVLECLARISDKEAAIPRPAKGKWLNAGEIMGDSFSIAWRVLDSQYWGVPQRRKRIYLITDFAGGRAGEILFESERMSRHSAEGFQARQRASRDASGCAGMASGPSDGRIGDTSISTAEMFENHNHACRYTGPLGIAPTVNATYGTGGNNQPFVVSDIRCTYVGDDELAGGWLRPTVFDCRGNGNGQTTATLTGDHQSRVSDYTSILCMSQDENNTPHRYVVRRLTPLECGRLQGFPDGWGDIEPKDTFTDEEAAFWETVRETHARVMGKSYKPLKRESLVKWYNKLHTDSAEYKMWGNGMTLQCLLYVIEGIAKEMSK